MNERSAEQILDREFLELRGKILELAASFDRLARAGELRDERMDRLVRGITILVDESDNKARRVQELFSRAYAESWRSEFGLD